MRVLDSLRSLIGNLGNPGRDKAASVYYSSTIVDREQLARAYESNWIARKIVDIPARDALRKWRTWEVPDPDPIEAEERRLMLRQKVLDAVIDARLYGGAAIYIGTDQDPAKPLDVDAVGPGGLKYLTVLGPDVLAPGDIERDPAAEFYGRPSWYRLAGANGQETRVHPSRLAIMRGDRRPSGARTAGFGAGWDQSVLVAADEIIKQTSGTFANIASMLFEANVDVIGVPDLMTNLSMPGYEDQLLSRFQIAAANKGINGSLVLDSTETYNRKGASFSDLPPIMETFALFAAAAADIPATRFLSRSPTGLTSTGGHEQANYFDKLSGMQELEITPGLGNLDACLVRSAGTPEPEFATYEWRPLEQMNDAEIAEIGKATVEYLKGISESGLYTQEELREVWTHRLSETKTLPHLEELVAKTNSALELDPLPEPDEDDEDEPETAEA